MSFRIYVTIKVEREVKYLGIFDFILKRKDVGRNKQYADTLNGYTPVYSQFGNDIYASDVVQQAISCIVSEMKKITPKHVITRNSDTDVGTPKDQGLQVILTEPNEYMTQSEFLEKVFWNLFLNYNSFIIPTYNITKDGRKVYTGLYPISPLGVDILQDSRGKRFIKFRFASGYECTLPQSEVIHLKYRYSVNEYMGGDMSGRPDHKGLLDTLELNKSLLDGVAKGLKSSYSVNGVIKYNTMLDDGKMDEAIKDFHRRLANNESGILPLDIKGEFIPMKRDIKLVDADTLKFIDEKILRYFGVPLPILTGDYTKAQYETFYQKTLDPLILTISQAFTKILFTSREKSFGNRIIFYPRELVFMDTSQKLEMIRMLGDSGALYENEKRAAFGLQPLPELVGVRMMSKNYGTFESVKSMVVEQYGDEEDSTEGEEEEPTTEPTTEETENTNETNT